MIEAWIAAFVLMLVRLATFWLAMPLWSAVQPPRSVKAGLALALAVYWFSQLREPPAALVAWAADSDQWVPLAVMAGREIALGAMLGFLFHLFLVPAQIAGSWIGQELGLSMATLADPATGSNSNIVSVAFHAIAVVLFFALDLHHFVIYILHVSFAWVPAGGAWNLDGLAGAHGELQSVMRYGLELIGPAGIVMLVTLVALMVLTRVAPTMNLFSVGISLRLFAGLVAVAMFWPHISARMTTQFAHCQEFFAGLVRSL
jgi:flagellar biosynthetic protein FliR